MEYKMTKDQEQLYSYLNWLRGFVVKNKSFDNQSILAQNLSKTDVFNVNMLLFFFNLLSWYAKENKINVQVKDNIEEYCVLYEKTYFKLGKVVNTEFVYVNKCEKDDNYYIDLRNLLGRIYANTNNDLNNIHLAIGNLLNKGLSINQIRKILDDYLNTYDKNIEKNERIK